MVKLLVIKLRSLHSIHSTWKTQLSAKIESGPNYKTAAHAFLTDSNVEIRITGSSGLPQKHQSSVRSKCLLYVQATLPLCISYVSYFLLSLMYRIVIIVISLTAL